MHQSTTPSLSQTICPRWAWRQFPQPPHSPDLAPCDFCLFPKLKENVRGCHYEMKESVTKVIDALTKEDVHEASQKLLERYNKCIATGGDYFEGDYSFTCVLSIKLPIRTKSGNLWKTTRSVMVNYRNTQSNMNVSSHYGIPFFV